MNEWVEWVEWGGGLRCPVSADTVVEVRLRGGECLTAVAGSLGWSHALASNPSADIVAYRVVGTADMGAPRAADPVNHPPHYTAGSVECIDAIQAALTPEEFRGYCKGNALKYVWRERHKGGAESLAKAQWYLGRLQEGAK